MTHQIMLSLHCASMLSNAEKLKMYLAAEGFTVFLCSEMNPGVTYRDEICRNASKCSIFVAFINQGWCKSKECEFEFNIALSESLKSPTRTPYIIPILLEEFSFYEQYPTVNGLMKNAMGIPVKPTELGEGTWAKLLKTITGYRKLEPLNSPTMHKAARQMGPMKMKKAASVPGATPKASATDPGDGKTDAQRRANYNPSDSFPNLRRNVALKNATAATPAPEAQPEEVKPALPDITPLVNTALKLIDEICAAKIEGTANLRALISDHAKSVLGGIKYSEVGETLLRALVDYLSKTKERVSAAQMSQEQLNDPNIAEEAIKKLVQALDHPDDAAHSVGEFIPEAETKKFWEDTFGKNVYSVAWSKFADAVRGKLEAATAEVVLKDLQMALDSHNTGHVACHRLAEFVGGDTLTVALQKYQNKPNEPVAKLPTGLAFPLLLWVDDHPENNQPMIDYAKEWEVNVVPLKGAAAAKQWLKTNSAVLTAKDPNQVHIISYNFRTGADTILDKNAGEIVIRHVRGQRSTVPIMVYCGDTRFAQYVNNYNLCEVTNNAVKCQNFIEQLFPPE